MNPKITIITINFNNFSGLTSTFQSVFNQTKKDFEYIVIDGGSCDSSKDVILQNQHKIDYWVSEPDSGIYNAMNKGIKVANGEYLFFLNSGDELFDNRVIENCSNHFNDGYTCISGNIVFMDGTREVSIKKHPEKMTFKYATSRIISHQSTFIKRDSFLKYGYYNEENKIVSDSEFFFKILALNGESYKSIDVKIAKFYFGGVSGDIILGLKETDDYFKKMLPHIYNNDYDTYIFNLFRVTNKRVNYLMDIESNTLLRKITTFFLMFISKLSKYLK